MLCVPAPCDTPVNSKDPVRELPVGRAAPQSQRLKMRVRIRTRCALRRRPPADRHKYLALQYNVDQRSETSPPREPTVCAKCGDALQVHMRAAADKISSRLRVHRDRVECLLWHWWQTALLWVWDRPLQLSSKRADLHLLHKVLHELAVVGPREDASSPSLGDSRKVTVELASTGLGPAGSVQVQQNLWSQWADPCFDWASRNPPPALFTMPDARWWRYTTIAEPP